MYDRKLHVVRGDRDQRLYDGEGTCIDCAMDTGTIFESWSAAIDGASVMPCVAVEDRGDEALEEEDGDGYPPTDPARAASEFMAQLDVASLCQSRSDSTDLPRQQTTSPSYSTDTGSLNQQTTSPSISKGAGPINPETTSPSTQEDIGAPMHF